MSFLDTLRTASPARQIALAVGAAVAIAAGLTAAYVLVLHKPYGVLFTDLRPMDAATITAELDKKKVPYHLEDGGSTIAVPKGMIDATRLAIASEDLPTKGTVGFELFNKSDMGLTEFAQRINYQRALQGELARTIMTLDSVESARVHLMLAEPTAFRDDRRPSKAAVTLIARPGKTISPAAVQGVQRLVAASVPDLAPGDVVVLDDAGQALGGQAGPSQASDAAALSAPSQEREAIEQYYVARIRRAVSAAFTGEVTIDVAARSDPSAAPIDDGGSALDAWTPANRGFPLTVTLGFPVLPNPEAEAEVKRLAAEAAGLDPARGDVLTLTTVSQAADGGTTSAAAPAQARPTPAASAPGVPRHLSSPAVFWLSWLAPAFVGLIVAAAYLHRRLAPPRRLSEAERRRIAARLKQLLDHEEAHAASSF